MSKLNAFKKLIKDAVREAVREELKNFNKDIPFKPATNESIQVPKYNIQNILKETKNNMSSQDFQSMGNSYVNPMPNPSAFNPFEGIDPSSLNMETMDNDYNSISMDSIPDFNGLMDVMKEKGQI